VLEQLLLAEHQAGYAAAIKLMYDLDVALS
jgi:hypothetical protein